MMLSWLLKFVFPPPPSAFITSMSVISSVSLANAGFSELRGSHLQYSKFWNVGSGKKLTGKEIKLSSRTGMFFFYAPACLVAAASLVLFPDEGLRFMLVTSALTVHFLKRVLEVLFVHKYSGSIDLDSAILITFSYSISTVSIIYAQHLTRGMPEPQLDLTYAGVVLFLVGICGNFYHHHLLSKLRESGDRGYKIPKGGLFNLVICPHYFFEILIFMGISFTSQTVYAFSFTIGTIFYLMGRSYATRKWYVSKFDNFPKEIKCLIPYIA
ncbi:PREDICTED: 3-oxo-5-alpha-steroid 4-dehydrogenase 1 [Nelumbo nucifera]|uniref:3-oxo-5-alpha-steroid 4-dehydrogenase 1 n=1 Tax=Nelumbo nucifera TaxID=4432 RepID=A0A1U7Z0T1_NELNU|nr:PREDICTED: 3-oxo-5-alpha-steroid 4-dehydrogenase 1 [Nelumbo nucifera]